MATTVLRFVQVILAVSWCLLAAGTVFGFAALKPILVSEGIYREACSREELEKGVLICSDQDLKMNYMFTVAAVLNNVFALPVGLILDSYGPRICGILGSAILCLACLCFTNPSNPYLFKGDSSIVNLDPFLTGYSMLAIGGSFLTISSFHLSNAFPQFAGTIMACLMGASDASSGVFAGYGLWYHRSGKNVPLDQFFSLYFVVPVFILVAQLTVMPSRSYKVHDAVALRSRDDISAPPQHRFIQARQFSIYGGSERRPMLEERNSLLAEDAIETVEDYAEYGSQIINDIDKSGVWGVLHGVSAHEQLKSPWFIFIVLFVSTQMLRINYFIATVFGQYVYLLDSVKEATEISRYFSVALPCAGVIAAPLLGYILDNLTMLHTLILLVLSTIFIGILSLIPSELAGFSTVTALVAYRPFLYSAVSDYCAKVFGFDTFGIIYGTCISLSGALSYAQAFLDELTHDYFESPDHANVILILLSLLVGFPFVLHVFYQTRAIRRKQLEAAAQRAPVLAMPGTCDESQCAHCVCDQ